jgi:hypothetical protein
MRLKVDWLLGVVGLVLVGALGAAPALAATGDDWCRDDGGHDRARFCEVRESTFAPGAALAVDARPNGGIEVRSTDAPQVRLQAKVVATADSEAEAGDLAHEVRIETGETVRAVGPASTGRHQGYWVSYRLEVPRGVHLSLRADNGGISLHDYSGAADLHTVNGGLHLSRTGGDVRGETVNGGVHVELSGSRWDGEGLDLRTTNGGLHVTVPADYNARLEMGTVNGGVRSDIPVTTTKRWTGGRIDTDLGQGGSPVRIETTNGGIRVSRR